jgi:hypothetical protein
MNPEVAKIVGEFGYRKKTDEEVKPKVNARVARMLKENLGVEYPSDQIQEEAGGMNPLGAPGDAPAANPNTPADQQGMQASEPGQEQQPGVQKRRDMPKVKLTSSVNRITTLQDLRDKMNEVTQRITTIDTLSQTLMGDNTTDNDLGKHKQTLKGAVDQLASSVRDLQNAFKD